MPLGKTYPGCGKKFVNFKHCTLYLGFYRSYDGTRNSRKRNSRPNIYM